MIINEAAAKKNLDLKMLHADGRTECLKIGLIREVYLCQANNISNDLVLDVYLDLPDYLVNEGDYISVQIQLDAIGPGGYFTTALEPVTFKNYVIALNEALKNLYEIMPGLKGEEK